MEIVEEYIDESLQFFLEATEKPTAIISLNGDIYRVNDEFLRFFSVSSSNNIKQALDQRSINTFEDTLQRLNPSKHTACYFNMRLNCGSFHSIKADLHFIQKKDLVMMFFTPPENCYKNWEKAWSSVLAHTEDLIFLSNESGYIQYMNDLSFSYLNLPKEHFIGRHTDHVLSLFVKDSFDLDEFKREALEHKYAETIQLFHHPLKNNRHYKIVLIHDFEADLFVLKITDCTKSKVLEQQLNRKESLLEVGQLAASVAHEIRNPITTLKGFTQLLKISATENTLKYLDVIEDEVDRMESILSEMLTLSKPTKIKKKPLSLKGLLDDIIKVISAKATMESIQLVRHDHFEDIPFLLGNEGRLKQVFLNLLKNSLESMQPGGVLTIYTQACGQDQVNIIIEDTGKGIDEHNLTQVFMPYFTTRPDGTGLGMPFVLQTVEEHGGTISVSSEVGKGTSFILTMPIVQQVERHLKQL